MKITIISGARPNFMKIAPIIRAINAAQIQGTNISYRLIYTGSKNDSSIDSSLYADLDIPHPDVYLNASSNDFVEIATAIMIGFDKELSDNPTDIVLVVDDLVSTMACTLVAKKRNIKVAHMVAGTRSFDINAPKEVNRIVSDALSDIFFTAGKDANKNLNMTGTSNAKIYFVGNILLDTIRYNRKRF